MRCTLTIAVTLIANHAAAQPGTPRWAPAIDSVMQLEMRRANTVGAQIAIVHDGRLAYTKGYGFADIELRRPVSEATLFQTGSVAKLFTGMLLGQLASSGAVDLRAPISRYVPEGWHRRAVV